MVAAGRCLNGKHYGEPSVGGSRKRERPEETPAAFFVRRATGRPEVIVQIRTTPRPRSKAMDVPYGFDRALIRLTIRSAVSAVAIDGVPRS